MVDQWPSPGLGQLCTALRLVHLPPASSASRPWSAPLVGGEFTPSSVDVASSTFTSTDPPPPPHAHLVALLSLEDWETPSDAGCGGRWVVDALHVCSVGYFTDGGGGGKGDSGCGVWVLYVFGETLPWTGRAVKAAWVRDEGPDFLPRLSSFDWFFFCVCLFIIIYFFCMVLLVDRKSVV